MRPKILRNKFVLKDNWKIETVYSNQDDQPFIDDLKLSLLGTLSTNASGLIEKYGGVYFTGYKDLDKQILGAIQHLSSQNGVFQDLKDLSNTDINQQEDKLNKLLYILRNIIAKRGFFFTLIIFV